MVRQNIIMKVIKILLLLACLFLPQALFAQSVCEIFDGAIVVADDGKYLGKITNSYDSESILNEYGTYGNEYSSNSIWNEYGQYGGEYSPLSPFNSYTSTPPRIIKNAVTIGYLSVNDILANAVSPHVLKACQFVKAEKRKEESQPKEGKKKKIMIFGGKDHKTYLGCLNCAPEESDSIFNKSGEFGNCDNPFADNLYCRGPFKNFGPTGPFHDLSACGSSASNPPVIVDEDGDYYGRFSIGGPFGHSDSVCASLGRFKHQEACEIVKMVCEQ